MASAHKEPTGAHKTMQTYTAAQISGSLTHAYLACAGVPTARCHASPLSGVPCVCIAGTAFYVLEQGTQYMRSDLPNTTSIQPSAADCANKCQQYSGKPGCTAWTWHHPTAPSNAGSCHLKAWRPDAAHQVERNSQATSGSIIGEASLVSDKRQRSTYRLLPADCYSQQVSSHQYKRTGTPACGLCHACEFAKHPLALLECVAPPTDQVCTCVTMQTTATPSGRGP